MEEIDEEVMYEYLMMFFNYDCKIMGFVVVLLGFECIYFGFVVFLDVLEDFVNFCLLFCERLD